MEFFLRGIAHLGFGKIDEFVSFETEFQKGISFDRADEGDVARIMLNHLVFEKGSRENVFPFLIRGGSRQRLIGDGVLLIGFEIGFEAFFRG